MSKLNKKRKQKKYEKLFDKLKSEEGLRLQNRWVLEQKRKQK